MFSFYSNAFLIKCGLFVITPSIPDFASHFISSKSSIVQTNIEMWEPWLFCKNLFDFTFLLTIFFNASQRFGAKNGAPKFAQHPHDLDLLDTPFREVRLEVVTQGLKVTVSDTTLRGLRPFLCRFWRRIWALPSSLTLNITLDMATYKKIFLKHKLLRNNSIFILYALLVNILL